MFTLEASTLEAALGRIGVFSMWRYAGHAWCRLLPFDEA